MIYHSGLYAKIKILYSESKKEKSIVFETGVSCRKELMSEYVQNKLKSHQIDLVTYPQKKRCADISEWLKFWVFYYGQ